MIKLVSRNNGEDICHDPYHAKFVAITAGHQLPLMQCVLTVPRYQILRVLNRLVLYSCSKPEHPPVGDHSCTTGNRSRNFCYDSWNLSHLGYLYPGTTPVMIKLDHNWSCLWVLIAQWTKAPTITLFKWLIWKEHWTLTIEVFDLHFRQQKTGDDLDHLPLSYDILCQMVFLLDTVEKLNRHSGTVQNGSLTLVLWIKENGIWFPQHVTTGWGRVHLLWNVSAYIFMHI